VSIAHEGEEIIAIKITGDDCVPAGLEAFRGRLPRGSQMAAVTWTAGLPKEPASTTFPGFLKIVDHHHFRAGNSRWNDMTFARVDDWRSR
jgi:hypothetical protein